MLAPRALGSLAFFRRRSQLLLRIEELDRRERSAANGRSGSGGRMARRALAGGLCALAFLCSLPAAPRAGAAGFAPPPLESLRGCLQLRYAVQAALARSLDQGSTQPPGI
jgi:hypothetical protein